MTFSRLTSIVQQAGSVSKLLTTQGFSMPISLSLVAMLGSVAGAAIYALLWWVLYLRTPGRRSEESARRLALTMMALAALSGLVFAPGLWLWFSTTYPKLVHGWEMALLIGGSVGIVGPVIAAKLQDKAEAATIPDLPVGKKP